MSRIGRKPVALPKGVTAEVSDGRVTVRGLKGTLSRQFKPPIHIEVDGEQIVVSRPNDLRPNRALHGTYRALIANMVHGVMNGFSKRLEIHGVGYRAKVDGNVLALTIGRSHPVRFPIPDGITIEVEKNTLLTVSGIDRECVGAVTAAIRALAPPEPYRGKGIRYVGEHVRRKAGKKVA